MVKTRQEADSLLSDRYYKHAINGYAEYLQQVIMTVVVKYHDVRNPDRAKKLQSTFATKKHKNLTLGNVINLLPRNLRTDVVDKNCQYVRNVRNDVSAHPYYVINLGRMTGRRREYGDVNTKRKYIRRICKHARDDRVISTAKNFLSSGHPLTIHPHSEQMMLSCENSILKDITKNVKKSVEKVRLTLEYTLAVETSDTCKLDYWMQGHSTEAEMNNGIPARSCGCHGGRRQSQG